MSCLRQNPKRFGVSSERGGGGSWGTQPPSSSPPPKGGLPTLKRNLKGSPATSPMAAPRSAATARPDGPVSVMGGVENPGRKIRGRRGVEGWQIKMEDRRVNGRESATGGQRGRGREGREKR